MKSIDYLSEILDDLSFKFKDQPVLSWFIDLKYKFNYILDDLFLLIEMIDYSKNIEIHKRKFVSVYGDIGDRFLICSSGIHTDKFVQRFLDIKNEMKSEVKNENL